MPPNQIGRYKILDLLGQGAMSQVYRVHDPRLGREVALKLITPPDPLKSDEWRRRFQREVRAAACLNHPHIVTVYDADLEHEPPYVVTELLTGGTLKERLLKQKPLPWQEALALLQPLCQALAYAHRAEVIHRDVKPGNVMFAGHEIETLKLVDFGLPRIQDLPDEQQITQTGFVMGTLTYMSPEQARGEVVDGRTDIFALGIICFEAIAGRNPLARDTLLWTLAEIMSAEPIDTSLLVRVPPEVISLIERAVAKNRDRRYPTCDALLADLDRCLGTQARALAPLTSTPSERPVIQKAQNIHLTPEEEAVLRAMFSDCDSIAVEDEYGHGLSGGRAFRVTPKRGGQAQLPVVVKIASLGLIEQEWEAYQTWVEKILPEIARIESAPISLPGVPWGGLRYALAGGGVFEVQSLHDYYQKASIDKILEVLDYLFHIMGQRWWLNSRAELSFQMQADYDALLPVNLLIKPTGSPSSRDVCLIEPGHLPPPSIAAGDHVQLKGFVVTEVDEEQRQLTLNLAPIAEGLPPGSYRLRLKNVSNINRYRVGSVVDSIYGKVTATRDDLLATYASKALEKTIDPSMKRLALSRDLSLPNPLATYQDLLYNFLKVRISTIHRDLNLENILVDQKDKTTLIDFATTRRGHCLHDLLRLETEVVTKLIPEVLAKAKLPPETIHDFYKQLHCAIIYPGRFTAPKLSHADLEKPFKMLVAIRKMARQCLFDEKDWTEYYQGLLLYLLGALKFKNLDESPEAPLPKQVAFWGAATICHLRETPPPPPKRPLLEILVALPKEVSCGIVILASIIIGLLSIWVTSLFAPPLPLGPPEAVIAHFVPEVEIKRANTKRMIPANFGMLLYRGDVVSTYDGATALIICKNRLWMINLPERNNLTIDCEDTTDPRIVGQLEVSISEVFTTTQAIVIDETRRSPRPEQEQTPLLLSPRNTVITDTRPTFRWQPVPEVRGYRLSLDPPGGESWSVETSATSLPYPAGEPPLPPGTRGIIVTLETVGKLGGEDTTDVTFLNILDEDSMQELAQAETTIQALELDEAAKGYLLAQLYREREMWAAAITQLKRLTEGQSFTSAYLLQQLGDLYFEIELDALAEEHYQVALTASKASRDKSAQAAAYFGLAHTANAFGEIEQALAHLNTAEALYRQRGEIERAEIVAAERAKLEQ